MTTPLSLKRLWAALSLALSAVLAFAPALPVAARGIDAAQETEADAESDETSGIELSGQLIELSSTDLPTTIVVRKNPAGEFKDYTVDIPEGAEVKPAMNEWITGDSLKVEGTIDENTGVVTAREVKNLTLKAEHKGLNGWVKAIDTAASTMTVTWEGKDRAMKVTDKTKMVVGKKNPAALSDFKVGDRVRARLMGGTRELPEARIIVALRRGDDIFLKARTRPFAGTLKAIDDASGSLTVELLKDKRLRGDDVNNLVGVPGELVTVLTDEHTKFVRRFKGEASLDELTVGDKLFIVGRVDDDGTILARLVKDESLFKAGVARHLGKVTAIDTAGNLLTVEIVAKKAVGASFKMQTAGSTADDDGGRPFKMRLEENLKKRLDAGSTWKVSYTDATKIRRDGKEATEADLKVGDLVRVEGVANATTKTVKAAFIHAHSADFHPLKRLRPLKEIVKERMDVAHGKKQADDIVDEQEPEDAEEDEDEDRDDDEDGDDDASDEDEDEDHDEDDSDEDAV